MDSGWLGRCDVFNEGSEVEKPVAGNLDLPIEDKVVKSSGRTGGVVADRPVVAASMENGVFIGSAPLECKDDVTQVCVDRHPVEGSKALDGDHSSRAESGKIKQNVTKEDQPEIEEASLASGAKKRARKPRSSKGQDTGQKSQTDDAEYDLKRKKGKKRQRETEEGEEQVEETERAQKKRRTKNSATNPPTKGRKKKAKAAEEGESDPEDSLSSKSTTAQKPKMPQENLLGEIDEEDVRAVSSRVKNPVRSR